MTSHIARAAIGLRAHVLPQSGAPALMDYLTMVGAFWFDFVPPNTLVLLFRDRAKMEQYQNRMESAHRREHAVELFLVIFDRADITVRTVLLPNDEGKGKE